MENTNLKKRRNYPKFFSGGAASKSLGTGHSYYAAPVGPGLSYRILVTGFAHDVAAYRAPPYYVTPVVLNLRGKIKGISERFKIEKKPSQLSNHFSFAAKLKKHGIVVE